MREGDTEDRERHTNDQENENMKQKIHIEVKREKCVIERNIKG